MPARLESPLQQHQQVLAVTLENMAQGLIMVDAHGHVRLHNKRFLEMLELPGTLLEGAPKFEDITRYQIESGDIKLTDGNWPAWTSLPHRVDKAPTFYERTRHDGTVLEVRTVHLPDGGGRAHVQRCDGTSQGGARIASYGETRCADRSSQPVRTA